MTRAVREWAALSEATRGHVARALDDLGCAELFWGLQADLAEHDHLRATLHEPQWRGYLIPIEQAGPTRQVTTGECESCHKEVGTGLTAWITDERTVLLLGPRCWRERALRRAARRAGEQLQLGTEAP